MTNFWLTFRIEDGEYDNRTYDERYDALKAVTAGDDGHDWPLHLSTSLPWQPLTAFVVFSTGRSIDEVAHACREAIALPGDLVLIHEVQERSARFIGDDENFTRLQSYMDYAQRVR